jgi:hypothetical protein
MDVMLVLVAILTMGTAVWLWRLSKPETVEEYLVTSLAPRPRVEMRFLEPRDATAEPVRVLVAAAILAGIAVGVALGIAYSIYLVINLIVKGYTWPAFLLILVLMLLLYFVLRLIARGLVFREIPIMRQEMHESIRTIKEEIYEEIYKRAPSMGIPKPIDYFARSVRLPEKVYEGDSYEISISLRPNFWVPSTGGELLHIQDDKSDKSIVVQFSKDSSLEQFLEIELLAAGLVIDGEKKQRQFLTSQTLSYHWNCYFPNSGSHTLSLVLRLASQSDTIELGAVQHSVKVFRLDHLTKRQVWLLASLAGIVSGGFAIAETLHQLGVW